MAAWVVIDSGDTGVVIFAPTADSAWRGYVEDQGECEYDECSERDCECWPGCRVERDSQFDRYEATGRPIPIEAYYLAGWHMPCAECPTGYDEPTDDWLPINGRALCRECAEAEIKEGAA